MPSPKSTSTLSALAKKLKKETTTEQSEPLWKGPYVDGITQGLLGRFLVCRERFRIHAIKGLRTPPAFNHRLEYGNMWHLCEEVHLGGKDYTGPLAEYTKSLCAQYPLQQEQIVHWYSVCAVQFPIYLAYWKKQKTLKTKRLKQEYEFRLPYETASGRRVLLRGKIDALDAQADGIWIQENKSKSEIDQVDIVNQLRFDLQTMFYRIAAQSVYDQNGWAKFGPFRGVRYNVIRRPLSGGKGSIRRHQPTKKNPSGESLSEFYDRLRDVIAEEPETYFVRWEVAISDYDIKQFRMKCLDPLIDTLCEWWVQMSIRYTSNKDIYGEGHYVMPYGVFNPLSEGGRGEADEYLLTGSKVGLTRAAKMFPELSE